MFHVMGVRFAISSPIVKVFMIVPLFLGRSQHFRFGILMPSGSGWTHISDVTPAATSNLREEDAAFIPLSTALHLDSTKLVR